MKRPIATYTPGERAIHLNSSQKRCHYWARHAPEGRDDTQVWPLGSDGNRRPSAASVAVIKQMRPPIGLLGAGHDLVRKHHLYTRLLAPRLETRAAAIRVAADIKNLKRVPRRICNLELGVRRLL